jgi:hypothetical protein
VKMERDRSIKERARNRTIEEVWGFLRKWIKPMIKEEKSLKEGLEKAFIGLSNPSSSLVE